MQTRGARQYDRWASLQRITAEDVTNFYDRFYVPEAMTLTVIGDLDRSEVLAIAERTFGTLVTRLVPQGTWL
jgi:predicted Zn-dependent peptidase